MDEKNSILKSAQIRSDLVTEDELAKINRFALKELTADEIFTFKAIAGDNHDDDRNFEPFTAKSLDDMAALYPGRPLMFDHNRRKSRESIVGRIYDAYTEDLEEQTASGAKGKRLILKAYIPRTENNADLIKSIEAGVFADVSTQTVPEKLVCSVCGTDNMKSYCVHWPGQTYEGKTCLMTIDGVKDVMELSFVYAGAQPRARTVKAFNPDLPDMKYEKKQKISTESNVDSDILDAEIFLMSERMGGEDDE